MDSVLYAHTVFCIVRLLRLNGTPLDPPAVFETERSGWLVIAEKLPLSGMPCFHARLEECALPPSQLLDPKLYRCTREGMLIKGRENTVTQQTVRQTWWVVPCMPPKGL